MIESSTRRYIDEEIYRVFCYFEDGMQTAKISRTFHDKLIVIEDIMVTKLL